MILVAVIIWKHPINKVRFAQILDALERRSQGEEVDLSEFRDVYGRKVGSGSHDNP